MVLRDDIFTSLRLVWGVVPRVFSRMGVVLLLPAALLFSVLVSGCEDGFERASVVSTLRVIAVQADNPYPKPGESVELKMLWHDGKSPADSPRSVEIMWLGGCFNPIGDYYNRCYPQLAEKFSEAEGDPSKLSSLFGFGDTYHLDIPADLISGRQSAPGQESYGLTYVFFAICAGHLRMAEPGDDRLPFGCFTDDGVRLGTDDYVPGYMGLYSFNKRTNSNPVLNGFTINGVFVDANDVPKFPRCTKGSCADLKLKVEVEPSSVEENSGYVDNRGNVLTEQMWVEYLATAGKVQSGPRLVNDATHGFNDDNGTDYTPPSEAGKQYLFAVVRDSRGGAVWVKQGVMFE